MRKTETKERKKNISKDPVFLIDLPVASDYGKLLKNCIDPDLTLNTKGILSNLHYSFKAFEEDSGNGDRKVYLLYFSSMLIMADINFFVFVGTSQY